MATMFFLAKWLINAPTRNQKTMTARTATTLPEYELIKTGAPNPSKMENIALPLMSLEL